MIKQLADLLGYEKKQIRDCIPLIVKRYGEEEGSEINFCKNDNLHINYDLQITSSESSGLGYCYIHINGALIGELVDGGMLQTRRTIEIQWR